uniref:Putative secreted protein n=1 Tax=Anopheles darlingi TaxID=43151 RepID=A0A2M4D170_ANODA
MMMVVVVMVLIATLAVLIVVSLLLLFLVLAHRGFRGRRMTTIDAALRDALGELTREATVIEPVPISKKPLVRAVRARNARRTTAVLVERVKSVVPLEQHLALLVRGNRVRYMLVVGTGMRKVLMVRLVLVDVVQIVRKVAGSVMVHRR